MNQTKNLMQERLTAVLTPSHLEIIDDSEDHLGHSGAPEGMGHFTVIIASPAFKDQGLVACHRKIYDALGEMMQTHIHALRIQIPS